MSVKYSYINLFPSPIHILDVDGFDEFKDDLIDKIYELKEEDPKGMSISNRNGWQSKGFDVSDEGGIIHSSILQGLRSFPVVKNTTTMVASAWININSPGAYNVKHSHPESQLSGVMWIKSPKDGGVIEFENPNSHEAFTEMNAYTEEFKEKNFVYPVYWFTPTEGRIVVFPSYLQHEVRENKSNEDRISISFNLILTNSDRGRFS